MSQIKGGGGPRTSGIANFHYASLHDYGDTLRAMLVEMRADRFNGPMDTTSSLGSAIVVLASKHEEFSEWAEAFYTSEEHKNGCKQSLDS